MNATLTTIGLAAGLLIFPNQLTTALEAHATVAHTGTNFAYTVFNDEPTSSPTYLVGFYLLANAPIDAVSSPAGCDLSTDNFSYVAWFCTNATVPCPNEIPPGSALDGFSIQSRTATSKPLGCAFTTWDHALTNAGPGYLGSTESPSITSFD